MSNYEEFLRLKTQFGTGQGIRPSWLPDYLFDFQKMLVENALSTGSAAVFADCGLGKGVMELVWAENVIRATGGNILIGCPLAVSYQLVREAEKFGINATRSVDGTAYSGITVTNYERLSAFNPSDFVGFVAEESSILKNFSGTRRQEITQFMRKMQFRFCSTATPSPNDFIELGTTSEALGYLGYVDMLNRFFKNDHNNSAQGRMRGEVIKWRLKGHADQHFWRWVCSWARGVRKPSDIGFADDQFALPPLVEHEHVVHSDNPPDGCLFAMPAVGLDEQRDERRRTITERCEKAAEIANAVGDQVFIGCHLNPEGDLLEKLIPDAVQVSGSDSDEVKEERLLAFDAGNERVLITKDKIGALGLNLQGCNRVIRFPSHSFESYYQFIRRCWRFGQKRPVTVDMILSEGDRGTLANLQRKALQADEMFSNLVAHQTDALKIDRSHDFVSKEDIPSWLSTTK